MCKKFTFIAVIAVVDLWHNLPELNDWSSKQLCSSSSTYIYCSTSPSDYCRK